MQILQWLFKAAHEQGDQNTKDQGDKPNDVVFSKNRRSKSKTFKFKPLTFQCNRDVARACFYSTIYLSRVRPDSGTQSMKTKKEDIARGLIVVSPKPDSGTQSVKTKKEDIARGLVVVSPKPDSGTCALSSLSSAGKSHQCSTIEKKEKLKGDNKTKTMSRMKELLRWAAATKSEKLGGKFIGRKVLLHFRNRDALKAVAQDDDQFRNESPKISFRWDVDSCSTTTSAFSRISMTSSLINDQTCNIVSLNSSPIHGLTRCSSRRGNWITTDSEFVVLEL